MTWPKRSLLLLSGSSTTLALNGADANESAEQTQASALNATRPAMQRIDVRAPLCTQPTHRVTRRG